MDHFEYRDGELFCEEVPVGAIAAEVGTPVYIYSRATIRHHYRQLAEAFPEPDCLICYSVKANSNLAILETLHEEGSGFDVVSVGELKRVRMVGGRAQKAIFAGVGKTEDEIRAAVHAGILMINVESEEELREVDRVAREEGRTVGVAIRVNPDVDPDTHEYITTGKEENKFGVAISRARDLLREATRLPGTKLVGLHLHIGSQITTVEPYVESLKKGIALAEELQAEGFRLEYLNMGGGFGIFYKGGEARTAAEFAAAVRPLVEGKGWKLVLEPGRFIVGNAGILVVKALYRKKTGRRAFLVTDGGMNDLIRPSLYGSYHHIWPVRSGVDPRHGEDKAGAVVVPDEPVDVVGPICESGDFLGKERRLPAVEQGDLLSVFSAGAYSFAMSSNYNSRPRPAEVLVDGKEWRVVRQRETFEDVIRGETR